jgi:hypothetical protein
MPPNERNNNFHVQKQEQRTREQRTQEQRTTRKNTIKERDHEQRKRNTFNNKTKGHRTIILKKNKTKPETPKNKQQITKQYQASTNIPITKTYINSNLKSKGTEQ